MKYILVIFTMLCINMSLLANNGHTNSDFTRLQKLLPGNITRPELKQIFGEAATININNKTGEEVWQYNAGERNMVLRWDTKNERLKDFCYSVKNTSLQNWSTQYASSLETGSSTLKQVLELLGEPTNMQVKTDNQQLSYVYANTRVDLQFANGVLGAYHVSNIKK